MSINRELSSNEQNWCRVMTTGTGFCLFGYHLSNQTTRPADLHKLLGELRESHPILACKIHHDAAAKKYTIRTSTSASPRIISHDATATSQLLLRGNKKHGLSPLQKILEHEMSGKAWSDLDGDGIDVAFGSVYVLSESERVMVLHIHPSILDRVSSTCLLRELVAALAGGGDRRPDNTGEGQMALEGLIPSGLKKKGMFSRGKDLVSYTVACARLGYLEFKAKGFPTATEIVRLRLDTQITSKILAGCEARGIKLCGVLAAAALLAGHSSGSNLSDKGKKKYGITTLTNCRPSLGPMISDHHMGLYQSVILSTHTIKGTETLWELAATFYEDFARSKDNNKHLTDMADLNLLTCKAIDNPGLTPSSSLRTSYLTVCEETVCCGEIQPNIGVVDLMSSCSIHGVGSCITIFDFIRNGELDCIVVYPSPLHSREQMEEIVEMMTKILMDASKC